MGFAQSAVAATYRLSPGLEMRAGELSVVLSSSRAGVQNRRFDTDCRILIASTGKDTSSVRL
jgi:hypothetical protein